MTSVVGNAGSCLDSSANSTNERINASTANIVPNNVKSPEKKPESKEDITDEMAQKVSSLLSNMNLIKSVISQLQGSKCSDKEQERVVECVANRWQLACGK